jgi:DNA-binding SARP family transcriptional activator
VRLLIDDGADPEQPIGWLTSLLNDDPFDESTHQTLISVLAGARRFGDARRAYRHYASRMAELDVPAVPLEQLIGFRLGT